MSDPMTQDVRSEGMPLWAKIGIGCVLVVAIGTATCVGVGWLIFKKGADVIEGFAKDEWAEMRRDVDRMMTDDGARALYAENPGLAERFPTEEEFLTAVRSWRDDLEPLPEKIPVFGGDFRLDKQYVRGEHRTLIGYTNGKRARVRFTLVSKRVIDIDVSR